jgi:hypothetical protein
MNKDSMKKQLEKYFSENFGLIIKPVPVEESLINLLPVFLRTLNFKVAEVNNQRLLFIETDNYDNMTTEDFRKRAIIIEGILKLPVVWVINSLEAYKRKRLIEKKIAFVIPGKQLYIPSLFMEFREYKTIQNKKNIEKLTPSAQCLLLYYLLGNKVTGINFKTLANKLDYGQMTISRAADALVKTGIAATEGGKNKSLSFNNNKKEIWNKALPYLASPVDKIFYSDVEKRNNYFISGINALSAYTNINKDYSKTYALSPEYAKQFILNNINTFNEPDERTSEIQIWKYNPGVLANSEMVDPLSLYLSFKENEDERILKEIEAMVLKLW